MAIIDDHAASVAPPQKARRPVSPNDRDAVLPGSLALPVTAEVRAACAEWLSRPLPMRPPGVRR